jgi:hypothetical protein
MYASMRGSDFAGMDEGYRLDANFGNLAGAGASGGLKQIPFIQPHRSTENVPT